MERTDQPRIEPIVGSREPAREFHRGRNRDRRRRSRSDHVVVVMPEHSESEEFQLSILESNIAAHAIEGFLDGRQTREEQSVLVLLVLAIVVEEPEPDRRVVPWTGWSCGLDGVAALRIPLQVELFREANVNVLRAPRSCSDIASVRDGHRPIEVAIIRIPAKFAPPLPKSKNS